MVRVKWLLLLVSGFIARDASAQFGDVHIGVNGLTCSQCTRNVEMRLRRLGFIEGVQMNLQHTDGIIRLKDAAVFDPAAIAKAVKDAGFSLRFLKADLNTAGIVAKDESCFSVKGKSYQLIPSGHALPPQATLQFIGPDFLPAAELKRWRAEMVKRCRIQGQTYFVTSVNDAG